MGIIEETVTPKKNYILRLWIVTGAVILAVATFMLWTGRFRETCNSSQAEYALFGTEIGGRQLESFSGKNFLEKMQKMGFPPSARENFLAELAENCGDTYRNAPILWMYARGLDKKERDLAVGSFGKIFFTPNKICISIEDDSKFSIQLNPQTFKVFWAKDGVAICAIPLITRPRQEKISLKLEERNNGSWHEFGKFALKNPVPANTPQSNEKSAAKETSISPEVPAVIKSLSIPKNCRFYSEDRANRSAFGNIKIKLEEYILRNGVPAEAWTVENIAIKDSEETDFGADDVFHTNVRFLRTERFETRSGTTLSSPMAKALFPRLKADGTLSPWHVAARLIRTDKFSAEEYHEFGSLKVSPTKGGSPSPLSFGGEQVSIRAFSDKDYFRLVANGVPALVLEIRSSPSSKLFWAPFRVITDRGEDLEVESIAVVAPGIYQFWYMPNIAPSSITPTYTITQTITVEAEISPEIIFPTTER